jgi:hypothetical protein
MGFLKRLARSKTQDFQSGVITFTGGMGAQILSAAIYFSMRSAGKKVYADLSYFDQPERVALAGQRGQCSHWAWQLDLFGLTAAMFETSPVLSRRNAHYLDDGAEKLERALKALADPAVREYFRIPSGIEDLLPGWGARKFLCIHVRRGDYVNVASHLVSDEAFISVADSFSGIIDSVVVLSDSTLPLPFREAMASRFQQASFFDQLDVESAHRIMRHASALICSNSQFSLVAAALNPWALAVIPKQWFGGADRSIEEPINARSSFQILSV